MYRLAEDHGAPSEDSKSSTKLATVDVAVRANTPGVIWVLCDCERLIGPAVRDDL